MGCNCGGGCGTGMGFAGLGQTGCFDSDGNEVDCAVGDTTDLFGNTIANIGTPGGSGTPIPTPVVGAPASTSPSFNWNSFLASWTNIGGSILKAEAGANPTYQATTPQGGTVTVYGSSTGIPAALASPFGSTGLSMGSILLIGGAFIGLMMLSKK